MKHFLLIIALVILPLSPAQAETALRLKETCEGVSACLRMYLYYDEARQPIRPGESDKLVTQVIPLNDDWTDYELSVKGRLNGDAVQSHRLLFRAYNGGLTCSRFGQGFVAVTGFSPAGKPLVLTSAGEVEITKAPKLDVGCPDCLQLLDSDTKLPVTHYVTPAWDLRLVGYRQDAFRYNALGEVFLQDGESCIRLANTGRFKAVATEHCKSTPRLVGHYGRPAYGITPAPAEWLFENPKTDHLMRLLSGACT